MSKNDILLMDSIAFYGGYDGVEIKDIEHGNEDYVLCVSGIWPKEKKPHRVKIYTTANGKSYFRIHGYRIPLDECVRMGI